MIFWAAVMTLWSALWITSHFLRNEGQNHILDVYWWKYVPLRRHHRDEPPLVKKLMLPFLVACKSHDLACSEK